MENYKVNANQNKCIGCGLCASICPAQNISLENNKASILKNTCLFCGHCSAICPSNAIILEGFEDTNLIENTNKNLDPQEILNTIALRRSIRKFKNTNIPQEVIEQILEAGRLTHTAKNSQDVAFVVLDKEKRKFENMAITIFKRILPFARLVTTMAKNRTIDDHFFFFKAPLVIVILANNKTNGILAAQNMEFVAEANGLGVLYSGFFTIAANLSFKIKKALRLSKKQKVAMTLVLGYPSIKYARSTPHKKLKVTYR